MDVPTACSSRSYFQERLKDSPSTGMAATQQSNAPASRSTSWRSPSSAQTREQPSAKPSRIALLSSTSQGGSTYMPKRAGTAQPSQKLETGTKTSSMSVPLAVAAFSIETPATKQTSVLDSTQCATAVIECNDSPGQQTFTPPTPSTKTQVRANEKRCFYSLKLRNTD